jgi:hypothetical protein
MTGNEPWTNDHRALDGEDLEYRQPCVHWRVCCVGSVRDSAFPTVSEAVALGFFPVGVALGFVIAWRREALGGAITVASITCFYLCLLAVRGRLPGGPYFILLAAPGFLFLANAVLNPFAPRFRENLCLPKPDSKLHPWN